MNQFYNLPLFIVLLLITATLTAQAQDHSLQEGSKAIQFQVNSNFTLSSFGGSAFSYKKQVSESKAHRYSLSFQSALQNISLPSSSTEQERTNFGTDISAIFSWQHYINPGDEVKAYYGYGPGISFGYQSAKDDRYSGSATITQKRMNWGLSAVGYSGVEWFINSSFSLHAEYRASFRADFENRKVTSKNDQTGQENTSEYNKNTFILGSNGVRFGLSVYF